jgi:hypothetical protein
MILGHQYLNIDLPLVKGDEFINIPDLDVENSLMNYYAKIFISYTWQIFDGRASIGYSDEQVFCYKKVFKFYQLISSSEKFINMYIDSWECLMDCLLDVVSTHLLPHNKYSIISSPVLAEEMSDLLAETVLYVWIKSQTQNKDMWVKLQQHFGASTRWPNVVSQWSRMLTILTYKLSLVVYGVNLEDVIINGNDSSRKSTPVPQRNKQEFRNSPGLDGKSSSASYHTQDISTTKFLLHSSLETLSRKPNTEDSSISEEDSQWQDLDSLDDMHPQMVHFLWLNLLCALGNVNKIERPEIHATAMSCLSTVWEMLYETRRNIPINESNAPDLFIFGPWLIEAAELSTIYADGRYLALACLCRLMCNQSGTRQAEEDYYPHFYRAVTKGLLEKDERIQFAIILHSSNIFTLNMKGSFLLIPYYVRCIERLFDKNQSTLKSNLSADSIYLVQHHSLKLLVSISHLTFHYKNMLISQTEQFGNVTFAEVR